MVQLLVAPGLHGILSNQSASLGRLPGYGKLCNQPADEHLKEGI